MVRLSVGDRRFWQKHDIEFTAPVVTGWQWQRKGKKKKAKKGKKIVNCEKLSPISSAFLRQK